MRTFSSQNLTFLIFYLFTILSLVWTYSISGNQLRDLESNEEGPFKTDADDWTSPGLVDPTKKVYFCYDYYFLGGYDILDNPQTYFRRSYNGLPMPHDMIHFSFLVRPIDSWNGYHLPFSSDKFIIKFDGIELRGPVIDTDANYTAGGSVCGNPSHRDFPPFRVIIDFPHTSSTLTVTVYSDLNNNSTDESFGFRDINMLFYERDGNPISETICAIAPVTMPEKWCPCLASNYYQNPVRSGNCFPCHENCHSCSGPNINQCLSCYPGKYRTSSNTCQLCHVSCVTCSNAGPNACTACIRGFFLTDQNNCVGTCPLPLKQTPEPNTDQCLSPCPSAKFVLWDQACSDDCNFPLEQLLIHHYKTCTFPCEKHEYLYWNKTCKLDCPAPLAKRIFHNRLFCDYQCDSAHYLYWDSLCDTSCSFPLILRQEGSPLVRNFCEYKCLALQYLYWNGSCLSTCDNPLTRRISHSAQFCDFPCSGSTPIVYWDKSCSSTCAFPLIPITEGSPMIRTFCKFPCLNHEYLYWNGTCSTTCALPLTYTISKGRYFCKFPCTSPQYLQWDGQCVASCSFPLIPRPEAGNNYCDYPCNSSHYLYWNGSCMESCDFPLRTRINGPAKLCDYPCEPLVEYLYWNGTCSSKCPYPLVPEEEGTPTRQYCKYPCQEGEYLYSNGSCKTSCNLPLLSREESYFKYCDYPCDFSGGVQYLYWNSSCLNVCETPLQIRVENSYIFCEFPCPSNEYLNWDGTCNPTCEAPLVSHTEGNGFYMRRFCQHKCDPKYLYWNGQCSENCYPPLKAQIKKAGTKTSLFCLPPCQDSSDYYYLDTKTCKNECLSPSYVIDPNSSYPLCLIFNQTDEGWFVRNILTAPQESGTVTLVMLVKLMQYIRYIDIPMSPRLQKLAMSKNRNLVFSWFGWQMSNEMQISFRNYSLPFTFQKHGFSSNFLVSFWEDFTTIAVVVFLAILFTILENVSKIFAWEFWSNFFERLRSLTRWNFALILFGMIIDDLVLFSSFQFRTIGDDRRVSILFTVFSFLGSLLGIGLSALFCAWIAFLVIKAQVICKSQREEEEEESQNEEPSQDLITFYVKWQDFQVLFRGFNTNSLYTHLFYAVYILRVCCLPILIASYFYPFPLVQSILQVMLSLAILAYIIVMNPLQNRLSHAQLVICEVIVLIMNFCTLVLVLLHREGVQLTSTSVVLLGDVIIFGNFTVNLMTLLFLFIKIMTQARHIHKVIKMQYIKDRTAWLQLLAIVFQQIGMGFEEISGRDLSNLDPSDNVFKTKLRSTSFTKDNEGLDSGNKMEDVSPQNKEEFDARETSYGEFPYERSEAKKLKTSFKNSRADLSMSLNLNNDVSMRSRGYESVSSRRFLVSKELKGKNFHTDEVNEFERTQENLSPVIKEQRLGSMPKKSFAAKTEDFRLQSDLNEELPAVSYNIPIEKKNEILFPIN